MDCDFMSSVDGVSCSRCLRKLLTKDPPEKCHAKCRAWPRWHELGHWTTLWLEVFGLSKKRWSWLKTKAGFQVKSGCKPCNEREAAMNDAGSSLATLIGQVANLLGRLWAGLVQKLFPPYRGGLWGGNSEANIAPRTDPQNRDLDPITDHNLLPLTPRKDQHATLLELKDDS